MVDSFFNSPFRGLPRNGKRNTHHDKATAINCPAWAFVRMHHSYRHEMRRVLLDISFSRNGILHIRYDAGVIQ